MVGLPRESRISRARMSVMVVKSDIKGKVYKKVSRDGSASGTVG